MLLIFIAWSWTAAKVMSQPPEAQMRELRRLERDVGLLQRGNSDLRILVENRLTKLEAGYAMLQAQNDKFQSVGIGAALTLFGLFAGTLWRMIARERREKQEGK